MTCFEFADGLNPLSTLISNNTVPNNDYSAISNILERTDLEIYYQKVSKAFATIPDTSGDPAQDQIQARVEENRIVGPISDEYRVLQITRNGQTATAVTVDEFDNPRDHGFSVGVNINVSGVTGSTGAQSELMQEFTTDLSQSHPHLVTSLLTKWDPNHQVTQSDQTSQ